jgi:hypothetical protein
MDWSRGPVPAGRDLRLPDQSGVRHMTYGTSSSCRSLHTPVDLVRQRGIPPDLSGSVTAESLSRVLILPGSAPHLPRCSPDDGAGDTWPTRGSGGLPRAGRVTAPPVPKFGSRFPRWPEREAPPPAGRRGVRPREASARRGREDLLSHHPGHLRDRFDNFARSDVTSRGPSSSRSLEGGGESCPAERCWLACPGCFSWR